MEAIGRLAGGVAHDMNNALAAIIGTADCLLEDATTGEARADAESILLSAKRASELTRNLLGFARRDEYRNEPLRPESLITSVATMLARTSCGRSGQIVGVVELDGERLVVMKFQYQLVLYRLDGSIRLEGPACCGLG